MNKNGVSLVALVITLIILILLAGVSVAYVVGDNGVVSNTIKMDLEATEGEVRDHLLVHLNEEILAASNKISGTTEDISTAYNEIKVINYLKGNQNYPDTEYAESNATKCIEEFENSEINGVQDITPKSGEGTIKSKYRVIATELCPDGDRYGVGKNISDGNIFTLEAVYNQEKPEEYDGKFELVYYDREHKRNVLDTVSFYMTNKS